jgi:hypothetical protein
MKYFKYIALLLLVAVTMGSCDKKDVSYMAEPVDESQMAYVQVGYYAPISTAAANNIYFVDINDVEYGNDGAAFLTTYNTVPGGGTNRYYAVPAGNINIKLHKRESDGNGGFNYPVVYNQSTTIQPGKRYCLYVHDFNQPPIPVEMTAAPDFGKALDTDSLCRTQFVNLLYENGEPIKDKVQYGVQNLYTLEYEPVGEPVAFGEVTPWFFTIIHKTVYNSGGTQRREVCLYRVDPNTNQVTERIFTDWWTWGIGRAYRQIAGGNIGGSPAIQLKQFIIE